MCTFIWASHCLSFFFVSSNWSDFSIFRFYCWHCSSSCLIHACIWIRIWAELLVSFVMLETVSLKILDIMIFFFSSIFVYFSFKIILLLISDDFFLSLTCSEVFVLRAASIVKLLSLFQQIKIVEVYHHRTFLIL